VYVKRDQEYGQ